MVNGANVEAYVIDAFLQLGIETRTVSGASDLGVDLVVDPGGVGIPVQMTYRSLVTDQVADRLLAKPLPPDVALLVVADRVTEAARTQLTSRRGGYLDLRGRLALRTGRLILDTAVEPIKERVGRSAALSGKAGLEVAANVLMHPDRPVSVRELARQLNRSPSTVSEILTALRREDLIDSKNVPTSTDLFWHVAERWPVSRIYLATPPPPGDAVRQRPLRLGLDTAGIEPGWALTDTAAAAAYGAPLAFRSDQLLDFFVPDQVIVRRATTLLGAAASAMQAGASVRVAPVPAVVQGRIDRGDNPYEWPLAHPLFVALDLAQDVGRGREILDAWTPDSRWSRVW